MVRNTAKHEFRVQWGGSGAFVAKCSCHEVASEFFATNAPDPPHWNLNSCFGSFCTVCVHLGPLSCLTKLGAKRSELLQMFVPRSCVESFRNERTRSTPLDPKLMFWCVPYHFGAFGTIWLPYETRCKMSRTSAKVCATKSRRNFSQPTHPIHPVGPQNISLGSNGVHRVLFWCVSYYLDAFGTIWLPHETRCKTGRTTAKVRATKSRRNFLQRTHPIHSIGP